MFKPFNLTDPIKNNEAVMDWLFDENLAEYQCYHMLFWVEYVDVYGPLASTVSADSWTGETLWKSLRDHDVIIVSVEPL